MSHRSQQIIDAMRTNIAANLAISWTIYRQRIDGIDVKEMELPAVAVMFAEDLPFSDLGASNLSFIDSLLRVTVVLVAEGASEDPILDQLLEMRRQSHISLLADRSQGLAFVIDTRYAGADKPIFANDADRYSGALQTHWHVHYRMNLLDPA